MNNLIFHPFDWHINDRYDDDGRMNIHCWGLTRENKKVLVRFVDFPVTCIVEFPSHVGGIEVKWNAILIDEVMSDLKKNNIWFVRYTRFSGDRLYYNGEGRYTCVVVSFKNESSMWKMVKLLEEPIKLTNGKHIKLFVYEHHIKSVRKLLTSRNLLFSGWMSIPVRKVDAKISTAEEEYIGSWINASPLPTEEAASCMSKPLVMSYDIETLSFRTDGFPNAVIPKDNILFISMIFQRYQEPSTIEKYGIYFGPVGLVRRDPTVNLFVAT